MIIGIEASHANKKNRTGVEEYCFEVINHLKKIIPADVRVILYSNNQLVDDLKKLPENWQTAILPWPLNKGWSQFRLSGYFLRHKLDLFFAPGQLVPFVCPKNTVTTIHDSAFEVFPNAYSFSGCQYLKAMNRLIMKKSKLIITPSEFSRQELGRLYGYDLDKVKVTPLGYDHNFFKRLQLTEDDKENFLEKYNIRKPFFLTVGRLEEKKNTVNIIKAFDLIKKEIDAELVLAGIPGRGFDKVKDIIGKSPNNKDINLLGWVENSELPKFYNLARVFIFPSLYEGFGLPLLHAMASGCPVVASSGNSLEEVGGSAALYVSPLSVEDISQAAIRLFGDTELRSQQIEKGLKKSMAFSWENTANSTWLNLREAIN